MLMGMNAGTKRADIVSWLQRKGLQLRRWPSTWQPLSSAVILTLSGASQVINGVHNASMVSDAFGVSE